MNPCTRRLLVLGLLSTLALGGASSAIATTINLRSGNVAPGNPEPAITVLTEPSTLCATPFATLFTAADFAAADAGPPAWAVLPHPAWGPSLWCDQAAGWISSGPSMPSLSTLYSVPFNVPVPDPCCLEAATLDFCWMADDILGDPASAGGPNVLGVYLDGQPLPIAGGNYAVGTRVIVDIKNYLHCGPNHLYIYNRDLGCAVSGINFSAQVNYVECVTPAKASTWGAVRALYRN